jgi:hypothetical protein
MKRSKEVLNQGIEFRSRRGSDEFAMNSYSSFCHWANIRDAVTIAATNKPPPSPICLPTEMSGQLAELHPRARVNVATDRCVSWEPPPTVGFIAWLGLESCQS